MPPCRHADACARPLGKSWAARRASRGAGWWQLAAGSSLPRPCLVCCRPCKPSYCSRTCDAPVVSRGGCLAAAAWWLMRLMWLMSGGARGDAQVATDDEINELIMRTEEELDMWQKMDQERNQCQAADGSKPLPRLMQVPSHSVPTLHCRTPAVPPLASAALAHVSDAVGAGGRGSGAPARRAHRPGRSRGATRRAPWHRWRKGQGLLPSPPSRCCPRAIPWCSCSCCTKHASVRPLSRLASMRGAGAAHCSEVRLREPS